MELFIQGVIAAVSASFVGGIIATLRLLSTIKHDVNDMKKELGVLAESTDAVFTAFRYMLTATRYQNIAMKQAGANGCTEQSDDFITKAEKSLERRHGRRNDEE